MDRPKALISDELYSRIENIVTLLKDSAKPIHIVNWLQNFYRYDWDRALTVIEAIRYFSLNDVIQGYDTQLSNLLAAAPADRGIYFVSTSEYGKSGPAMIYLLKKTPTFRRHEDRLNILTHSSKLKRQKFKDGDILILLDDFIGSGHSWIRHYNMYLSKQIHNGLRMNIVFMCIAYINDVKEFFKREIPVNVKIFGTPFPKAFGAKGSPFGYRPRMIPIRNLAYKYADDRKLFVKLDKEKGKHRSHPLGFENSQGLIVFEHSVPNNTLPIIWSSKNNWIPLFARSAEASLKRSKEIRTEAKYWISVARKLELIDFLPGDTKSVYSKVNYQLFSILKLKKQNASEPKMFQLLGIGQNEYDHIIENGAQRGLFDSEGNLTAVGENACRQIASNVLSLEKEKQYLNRFENNKLTDIYVPKIFQGKT
jgi:hypothetical protein